MARRKRTATHSTSGEAEWKPRAERPLQSLAELDSMTRRLAAESGLTPAQTAVALITYFEDSGQLRLGQNPASLVGKVVGFPGSVGLRATYKSMVDRGLVPATITSGRVQRAREVYETYTTGRTTPAKKSPSGRGAARSRGRKRLIVG